ncbi:MAG: DUF1203 domain-containing protein [Sphingobium sp.]
MVYKIEGLDYGQFAPLFAMSDEELARQSAMRVHARAGEGYPCRVTLQDAGEGETVILLNHVSHDVSTPYRSSFAIYVREMGGMGDAPVYIDCTPPVFEGRPIALRAFDAEGMLQAAALALPGKADLEIRALFARDDIAYIHAHNAAHGCFAAYVNRC